MTAELSHEGDCALTGWGVENKAANAIVAIAMIMLSRRMTFIVGTPVQYIAIDAINTNRSLRICSATSFFKALMNRCGLPFVLCGNCTIWLNMDHYLAIITVLVRFVNRVRSLIL